MRKEWFQNKKTIFRPHTIPLQLTPDGVSPYRPNKSQGRKALLHEWSCAEERGCERAEVVAVDAMALIFSKPYGAKTIQDLAFHWSKRMVSFLTESIRCLIICFDKGEFTNFAKSPTQVRFSLSLLGLRAV